MKYSKLFFAAFSLIFLFSCGEDEISFDQEKFVGSWKMTDLDYSGTSSTEYMGQKITLEFTGEAIDEDVNITFTTNPNEVVSSGSYGIILETTIMGQTTTEEIPEMEFVGSGTWTLSGDQMTVTTAQGVEQKMRIISLDDNSMTVSWGQDESASQGGATVTYDVDGIYTFVRQ